MTQVSTISVAMLLTAIEDAIVVLTINHELADAHADLVANLRIIKRSADEAFNATDDLVFSFDVE